MHILFTILSTLLELHSLKNTIDNARMVPSTMNIPNVYVHAINFVLAVLQQSVLTWLLQKYTMIIVSGVYAQFFAHNLEYR